MDIFTFLRAVDVLEDFSDEALRRLEEKSWVLEYSPGQVILNMGDQVTSLGLVVTGTLEARLHPAGDRVAMPTISKGQIFGEMSLLTGEPSIADIVAASQARVVHVPHSSLTEEIGRAPLVSRGLAKLLATRLSKRSGDQNEQDAIERARNLASTKEGGGGMENKILVLNAGSSSVKYALFDGGATRIRGLVENLGTSGTHIRHDGSAGRYVENLGTADHETALNKVFELLIHPEHGCLNRLEEISAVGHRTVHGGTMFSEATQVNDDVLETMRRVSSLAPLHNPANIKGIELCTKLLPEGIPQVAVFDTAFHLTMPEHAYRYAIPTAFADKNQLRRFGFHGTSHRYVSKTASSFVGVTNNSLKIVSCHLGNGASMAAVDHGRSVDTSMGLTPLEGLVMGTRAGDLDPGLVLHLLREGMTREEIDEMLNKKSGLLGLSDLSSDMRELEGAADAGHPGALLAIQTFCYRIRKYIGAYTAAMGGLDALVFTGGIGENSPGIRSRICNGLSCLGIDLDQAHNQIKVAENSSAKLISKENSTVKVLVVPTDEESVIAKETADTLSRSGVTDILKARRDRPVPIGISAHHVHLCPKHVEILFGEGRTLTPRNELSQKGYFAAEETVDLIGPKGRVDRVRVLGPERDHTQVEISRTEEFKLGIDAPIRESGNVKDTPGILLKGSTGELVLEEGVICAYRHIHMNPEDALAFGLRDKDVVRVLVEGERSLIFGDVLVRVFPGWSLEMHIDTDEANAAEVSPGATATIESIHKRAQ